MTAARVGGLRLEIRGAGHPDHGRRVAGPEDECRRWPRRRTSSSAQPVARLRRPPRAQAAPRQYGTSQPAATLIQPSHVGAAEAEADQVDVERRRRAATAGAAWPPAGSPPSAPRRPAGTTAGTAPACARRVHGRRGRAPEASIAPAATVHTTSTAATGRNSRASRAPSHCAVRRAAGAGGGVALRAPPARPPGRRPRGSGTPRRPGPVGACAGAGWRRAPCRCRRPGR